MAIATSLTWVRASLRPIWTGTCYAISVALIVVAVTWYRGEDAIGLPLITAIDGPIRQDPVDPGGAEVPYDGMEIYNLIESPPREVERRPDKRPDRIQQADIPPPESRQTERSNVYVPVPRPSRSSL